MKFLRLTGFENLENLNHLAKIAVETKNDKISRREVLAIQWTEK
jgi:hypothetical protein